MAEFTAAAVREKARMLRSMEAMAAAILPQAGAAASGWGEMAAMLEAFADRLASNERAQGLPFTAPKVPKPEEVTPTYLRQLILDVQRGIYRNASGNVDLQGRGYDVVQALTLLVDKIESDTEALAGRMIYYSTIDSHLAHLEDAKSEGRREILAEIAKLDPRMGNGSAQCVFCFEEQAGVHTDDCLWRRATEAVNA